MSFDLLRTVQHRWNDGGETVNTVHVITYDESLNNEKALILGVEDGEIGHSITIHSRKHMNDLIAALKSAALKVDTWEEAEDD